MTDGTKPMQYVLPHGLGTVEVVMKDETLWCTQKAMAQIFGVGVPAISKHLKNIFDEKELNADSVISKMETTAADGKSYETSYYSLDAIIAVGYRVSSMKATRFRQWATKILNEYIRKGFAMDDDRLKQLGGGGYWRETAAGRRFGVACRGYGACRYGIPQVQAAGDKRRRTGLPRYNKNAEQ